MVGLDLSETLLQLARTDADTQGTKIRWIQGDMRTIPFENTLDAVINVFTSFGYLANEEEDLQVLAQIHKALRPGGRFLLETVHQPRHTSLLPLWHSTLRRRPDSTRGTTHRPGGQP
jgi:SAM-dependent methyltransferase